MRPRVRNTIASGLGGGAKQPRGPAGEVSPTDDESEAWPVPDLTILQTARHDPPPLPVPAIFGDAWGQWIEAAAEGKGAPCDYVAGALLAVAGSLIGKSRWAHPYGDWREPPVIWSVLVGNPSSRKSPGLDAVRAPLEALSDRLMTAAAPALEAWRKRKEIADLHDAAWREKYKQAVKKRESLPTYPAEADAGDEPLGPVLEINDATVEGLTKFLARQQRGTLVVRDELAGWLGGMNRYHGGSSDRPFWIEAYCGRRHAVDRVSRDGEEVRRLSVSLVGCIQPEPLSSLLLKPDDDGMVARFCPFWPLLSPPKRPVRMSDSGCAEQAFGRLHGLKMPTDYEGDPKPDFNPFPETAQARLDAFTREAFEWEKEAEGSGLLVSFIGKTNGLSVRIALILTFLDWAASDQIDPPVEISEDYCLRAVGFVRDYALPWPA